MTALIDAADSFGCCRRRSGDKTPLTLLPGLLNYHVVVLVVFATLYHQKRQ
jgi:hypothetical protein